MKLKLVFVAALLFVLVVSGCVQQPVCGNGICEDGESYETCSIEAGGDCPPLELCGNGVCDFEQSESYVSCPADCEDPFEGAQSIFLVLNVSRSGDVNVSDLKVVEHKSEVALDSSLNTDEGYFSIKLVSDDLPKYHSFKPEFTIMTNPPIILEEDVYIVYLPREGVERIEVFFEGDLKEAVEKIDAVD